MTVDLVWLTTPSPFSNMEIWGAIYEPFSYVLSYDGKHKQWGASANPLQGNPVMFTDLGAHHKSRDDAEAAIKAHIRAQHPDLT